MSQVDATACPECGAETSGKFCDQCGFRLGGAFCGACGSPLGMEARFCGGCGQPANGQAISTRRREPTTPWLVAAVLSTLAIILVVWAAVNRGDVKAPGVMAVVPQPQAPAGTGTPPNLDDIPLREQFSRLNDRVMNAAESGDSTTVIQFWPMAEQSFHRLPESDRDIDARYHMATLQLLVGRLPQALAQADTIMADSPDNLMGWYIRGVIADYQGDSTRAREAKKAFLEHYDSERATGRQEYVDHADILAGYKVEAERK